MASSSTRGPVEEQLLTLLNKTQPVVIAEVHALLSDLLDCTREDMYQNLTFQGKILPGNSQ